MPSFAFVDLFAGLGGFHVAGHKLGGHCVFASELKPQLRELYQTNFGVEIAGDIQKIPATKIPCHDVLFAGFPCQPFSKAGEQLGWEDAVRGTLFWDVSRIVRRHKPSLVVLENVSNFVHHDKGNTYELVRKCLTDLGYCVEYKKLSPHEFGIPQVRERVFIVAKRGKRSSISWPSIEFSKDQLSLESILEKNPSHATPLSGRDIECLDIWQEFLDAIPRTAKLPSFPIWGMEAGATYPFLQDSLMKVELRDLQETHGVFGTPLAGMSRSQILAQMPSYSRASQKAFPKWKQDFIRQNREFFALHEGVLKNWKEKIKIFPPSLQKLEWNCQGEERDLWKYVLQFRASGIRTRRTSTSPSLVAMTSTQIPIIAWEKRYMTPKEGARLQSLDGLKSLPNGQLAFEALGNAVNATVVEKVLSLNL
jgi:DNA (cytosine-5)-methyltransferase 1